MKKWFCYVFAALLLFLVPAAVWADNAEIRDKDFDFTAVRTVYVQPDFLLGSDADMPDLDRIKALAFMTDYQKYLKHYTVVSDPEKADVQVRVTLSSWGYTKEWHEPEEYIEDETITHVDKNGKKSTTTVPMRRVRPGYSLDAGFFSADFEVLDQDGKTVYQRIDARSGYKKPYDMFGRAVKDFYQALNKLGQK